MRNLRVGLKFRRLLALPLKPVCLSFGWEAGADTPWPLTQYFFALS